MVFSTGYYLLWLLLWFDISVDFCWGAASGGSCSRQEVSNAVLKREYNEIEEFDDGASVQYECKLGYSIEGRSRERRCDRGIWSSVRFTCTPTRCTYVEHPEHGRRTDANNIAGLYTRFECDLGYKLKGPRRILCRTDGGWSPLHPPTCQPILCPELPRIQNGRVFQDTRDGIRNNYESVSVYTCNSGYLINGNEERYTRECQAGGTWTGKEPYCDVPRCDHIQPFYGGEVVYFGDRKRWTLAFYRCNEADDDSPGYSLFPNNLDNSECMDSLKWSPNPPSCYEKAIVEKPSNSYIEGPNDILLHGESYTLICRPGYEMYKDVYLERTRLKITNNNGTLSPKVPICEEARCDPTDQSQTVVEYRDGSKVTSKILSGTKVRLSCPPGYDFYSYDKPMNKPVLRNCKKGNIKRAPTCEEERCLFSGYPSNSNTYHRIYRADRNLLAPGQYIYHDEKIQVFCREGYELHVKSTQTYLKSFTSKCSYGQFDKTFGNFPVCEEERCLFKPNQYACMSTSSSGNCRKREFKVQSGSSVTIKCKNGYKLYRSEDGSSVEVNDQASVNCSKGGYFEGYKCIPDSYLQKIEDYVLERARDVGTAIDRFTCRFSIFGLEPCDDPCLIPEIPFGYAKNTDRYEKISGEAGHGTQIKVWCEIGYELSESVTTTCTSGEWNIDRFPSCSPKPCQLKLKTGTLFWVNSSLLTENDERTQTFGSGTKLYIECENGYDMKNMATNRMVKNEKKHSTCDRGTWTHKYSCNPAQCSVPIVHNASILTKATETYNHEEKIILECDKGHHFVESYSRNVNGKLEATCLLGNWSKDIPTGCQPDSCNLTLQKGSKYFTNYTVEITAAGPMKHGTHIYLQCMEYFDIVDEDHKTIKDINGSVEVICHQGQWHNVHFCKKQCVTFNVTSGRLISNGENTTAGEAVAHGDSVSLKCDGSDDYEEERSIICNNGNWKGPVACVDDTFTTKTATEPTSPPDGNTMEESNSDVNDEMSNENQQPTEQSEGCELSSDERYIYTDDDSRDVKPGSFISSGTTLMVMCREIDLYEYLTDYDSYYNETSEPTVTCTGKELSHFDLNCRDVTQDKCLELQNGKVTLLYGQYNVSCNKGFSLNLFIPEKSLCTCEDGVLKSIYGNQKPACLPDNCVLPYDIDDRLSVTDRNRVSLSGGSTVENDDYVFFNCSKVNELKYEPLNRRFKCVNGQWVEDEKDQSWKLGYNGKLPACREAICEPNCTNGGVCYKDNKCKCKHLTKGAHCETVLCDVKCNRNGGECVAPGICSCPAGRFGSNCERRGCKFPELSAKPKISKIIYKPGDKLSDLECEHGYMLSSNKEMKCQDDGTWSDIVACVKAVVYLISVKTDDRWGGVGTNAKVYIYLHGQNGKTNRIYLNGDFETGDLDETRKMAKDIRPITEVVVGHDGSGSFPDWHLEFASIYVENMNEYYVFRFKEPVWVTGNNDVTLPRHENCISTFDNGWASFPDWKLLNGREKFIGEGGGMSLRACQQKCTELTSIWCWSVSYNRIRKICWGFSVSSADYFLPRKGTWNSALYLRSCK